jgi:hypothetical protein
LQKLYAANAGESSVALNRVEVWLKGMIAAAAAANDSGAITQNYAAAASLTVAVQTASAGCATSPADINVVVQYRMQ